MRVIIAGSRTITDPVELETAIKNSGFVITEVICGGAVGADALGKMWAQARNIPVKFFLPDWSTYGKGAGPIRNTMMATDVGETGALIALWDGVSKGTADMIRKAERFNLKMHIHIIKKEESDGN